MLGDIIVMAANANNSDIESEPEFEDVDENSNNLPIIVQFAYENYTVIKNKDKGNENDQHKATCKLCKKPITDTHGTTSGFTRSVNCSF